MPDEAKPNKGNQDTATARPEEIPPPTGEEPPLDRSIFLRDRSLTDAELEAYLADNQELLADPYLTVVELSENQLTERAVELLAGASIRNLEELHVSNNRLGDAGARLLAASPPFRKLAHLSVEGNQITAGGVKVLLREGSELAGLKTLELSHNPIGDEGAAALGQSALGPNLRVLRLLRTGLTASGAGALFASGSKLSGLERLELSSNPIGDAGAEAIATSRPPATFQSLALARTGLTDAGARALAAGPALGNLRRLTLSGNPLTAAGIAALLGSDSKLTSLGTLYLGGIRAGDEIAAAVATSPGAERLETLYLDGTGLTDAGAAVLAGSPALRNLRSLNVAKNQLTDRGEALLRESPHLQRCRILAKGPPTAAPASAP